jgi:hypothetical protein
MVQPYSTVSNIATQHHKCAFGAFRREASGQTASGLQQPSLQATGQRASSSKELSSMLSLSCAHTPPPDMSKQLHVGCRLLTHSPDKQQQRAAAVSHLPSIHYHTLQLRIAATARSKQVLLATVHRCNHRWMWQAAFTPA